jgi:hypothetical protein
MKPQYATPRKSINRAAKLTRRALMPAADIGGNNARLRTYVTPHLEIFYGGRRI